LIIGRKIADGAPSVVTADSASSRHIWVREPSVLEIDVLSAGYGRGEVLRDVSVRVDRGALVGILGANALEKSTLALTIFGNDADNRGRNLVRGKSLAGSRPNKSSTLG